MHQSNNAAKLIQEINTAKFANDYNYSYLNNQPGFFTVVRRNTVDPFKSQTIMQVAMIRNYPFLDEDKLMKVICEFVAKQEHEYNKK